MKKIKTKRMLVCPYEGCKVAMGFMEHVDATCRKHGYKLVEKEVEVKKNVKSYI